MNEIMGNMELLKDDLFEAISKICKDYEAKKPEFKVGQWVISSREGNLCPTNDSGLKYKGWKSGKGANCNEPMRIIDICHIDPYPRAVVTEQNDGVFIWSSPDSFRPATPQEIESHLIKIAKEKGLLKDGLFVESPTGYKFHVVMSQKFVYDIGSNYLSNLGMFLYQQGRWAEIIPDKKKLPATKEELKDLCLKLHIDITRKGAINITEFLNDYTD